jgi:hypothetical protein
MRHVHESASAYSIAQSVLTRYVNSSRHLRSTMVEPPAQQRNHWQVAEKLWLQAAQKDPEARHAKFDELRRTLQ